MDKNGVKSYSKKYAILSTIVILVSFFLILSSLNSVKYFAEADEGYYLKYATYISMNGITKYPDLFRDFVDNKDNWLFPSPLRIGFVLLSAASLRIFGDTFFSLSLLSLFSYLAFLFVSFFLARRYFDEWIAFLLTILLAFSPINMAMARRALQDSTANLFYILTIWLFFDLITGRNRIKYIIFVFIFSFSILIKEPAVLLSPIFILYLLYYRYSLKGSTNLKDVLCVTVLPCAVVGLAYVSFAGGFSYIADTAKIILTSHENNPFSILYESGPWFRYLIDFMLLSPWVCILSIGSIFYCLTLRELDRRLVYFLIISVSIFLFFNLFHKSIRYLIMLDTFMRLFAILMIKTVVDNRIPTYSRIATGAVVIAIAVLDYVNFNYLFVQQHIYDPASFWLLKARHIIPWH